MHAYPICLNVFPYVVMYRRLVICSLNDFIGLCTARMSYYRGVVYKFKYLKL